MSLEKIQEYCANTKIDVRIRFKALYGFMDKVKVELMPKFNDEIERIVPEWSELRS